MIRKGINAIFGSSDNTVNKLTNDLTSVQTELHDLQGKYKKAIANKNTINDKPRKSSTDDDTIAELDEIIETYTILKTRYNNIVDTINIKNGNTALLHYTETTSVQVSYKYLKYKTKYLKLINSSY